MSLIVQKFGGTSVATIDKIRNVANIIKETIERGDQVVAVVSAMAGVTNKFIKYVSELDTQEGDPEYDGVVSSGELITAGLLSIALKNAGIKARSYAAWQIPIKTTGQYSQALIEKVNPLNLEQDIFSNTVPVVCGFQGINEMGRITTLGRGGSDLTAVAISAAIKADLCEIYSDVDGVYTIDPNLYPDANRIDELNYMEMLEMAGGGAKVLQERSVDYALKNNVRIRVASSFVKNPGTIISSKISEKPIIGMAVTTNLAQIKITCNQKIELQTIYSELWKNYVRAELFYTTSSHEIIVMVDQKKANLAIRLLKSYNFISSAKKDIHKNRNFSRISIIGKHEDTQDGKMFSEILREESLEVFAHSTFSLKVNLIIFSGDVLKAISILHKYCGL